jgi:hypothetical protein
VTPFQTICFSENLVLHRIESGAFGTVARYSEHQTAEAEMCVNLCGYRVLLGLSNGSLRPFSRFSRLEPLFHLAPQLSTRGCVDPVPDQVLLRKSGISVNRTRGLCDCSQEL